VLDWLLIFGNLGAPRLGIEGAAASSVAAEFAACAFLTLYAWRRGDIRRYQLFTLRRWDRALTRVLIGVSSPVILEALVETASWFLIFAIIEQLGEAALASVTVLYCCYALLLVPVEGFSEAACSMASNLIGQGAASRIRLLIRNAMSLSFAVTLPLLVLAVAFPEQALAIFTDEEAAIELGRPGLLFVAGAILVAVPGEVLLGVLTGTGDTRGALVIEVADTACVLTLCYVAAVVLGLPLQYVWLGVAAGWVIRIALSLARLRRQVWRELSF
jgi:Na+-driven multidrug efflux pump